MTVEKPQTAAQREGIDFPEAIVRTDLNANFDDSIKDLAKQAFAGNPDAQPKYAESIKMKLKDHARNYFGGDDTDALSRYLDFVRTQTDAKKLQIVHNRQENSIAVAYLDQNGKDITDKILHQLYLSRKIDTPKETKSDLAELSRGIIVPADKKLPQNPYQKK